MQLQGTNPDVLEPLQNGEQQSKKQKVDAEERARRMAAARKTGRQIVKFLGMFFVTLICLICIIGGVRYKDDCPAEPMIPVYLSGTIQILP